MLVWALVVFVLLWALVRTLGLEAGFPLVPLLAFTPYVAAFALVPVGLALIARRWLPLGLALVAILALAIAVIPRTRPGPLPAAARDGTPLRVVTANAFIGEADARALVRFVGREIVDVLSVQELTPKFAAELERAGVLGLLPNNELEPRRGPLGTGIYAAFPLRRVGSVDRQVRGTRAPIVELRLPSGASAQVIAAHPDPPSSPDQVAGWSEGLAAIPAPRDGVPTIVAGDLNATLDHAALRRVLDRGYADAAAARGAGLAPTWPSGALLPPPMTIDHILVSRRIGVADVETHPLEGSDHRALSAELLVPPAD